MQKFTASNGITYDVSDRFGAITLADAMTTAERIAVESRRATLDRIVAFLDGAMPAEALGQSGATLDQVHGQEWRPDTCGCVVREVYDHYAPGNPRAHRSVKHCAAHAPAARVGVARAADEHATHHAALKAENAAKNSAVTALAATLGVPAADIAWTHGADRTLTLRHPAVASQRVKAAAAVASIAGVKVE